MQRCKSVDLKLNHKKRDLYDYYFVVTKSGQALPFVVITELFTFVGISGYFGTTSPQLKVFITKSLSFLAPFTFKQWSIFEITHRLTDKLLTIHLYFTCIGS